MENVQDLILAAWERVWTRLQDQPEELAKRIARRRTAVLSRPPRAWCVAIRASDRRIDQGPQKRCEHQVTVTAELLDRLCEPVKLYRATLDEASAKLGRSQRALAHARLSGRVRTDYVPGRGGRHGSVAPLLGSDVRLDPCAKLLGMAEQAWGWTGRSLTARIPRDLAATLTRAPRFRSHVPRHRYAENAHPELDAARRRTSQRLPAPPPDYVWYKWSRSGHYLGDDPTNWRKSAQDLGERPAKWRQKPWRNRKRCRVSKSGGSIHFRGFDWICPRCGKRCATIYYPVRPVNLLEEAQPRIAQCVEVLRKTSGFACARCHGVNFCSLLLKDSWNQLIAYLSGGLLYGREVPRPAWWKPQRKIAFAPRPTREPSRRRAQIMEMILAGKTHRQIAAELGLKKPTIDWHANIIFVQHGVHSRAELARRLGRAPPPRAQTPKKRPKRSFLSNYAASR